MNDPVQALIDLGFTDLEARCYVALLQEQSLTGYGVAKRIGKPQANVYKALDSLLVKGAVIVSEGGDRNFRAVPQGELLEGLKHGFQQRHAHAIAALAKVEGGPEDGRIYRLNNAEQTMQKCRALLVAARSVVLLDVWPGLLEEIRPEVEAAIARGVRVMARLYRPVELEGAEINVLHPRAEPILTRWEGQWIAMVVDGRDFLVGYLDGDGSTVRAGVTSSNSFLAAHLFAGQGSELRLSLVEHMLAEGLPSEVIRDRLEKANEVVMMGVTDDWVTMQREWESNISGGSRQE